MGNTCVGTDKVPVYSQHLFPLISSHITEAGDGGQSLLGRCSFRGMKGESRAQRMIIESTLVVSYVVTYRSLLSQVNVMLSSLSFASILCTHSLAHPILSSFRSTSVCISFSLVLPRVEDFC